jgi:hypothetical protein
MQGVAGALGQKMVATGLWVSTYEVSSLGMTNSELFPKQSLAESGLIFRSLTEGESFFLAKVCHSPIP